MSVAVLGAIIASIPALALWASWPRRPWAAWAVAAAATAAWLLAFALLPPGQRPLWLGLGAWILFAGAYAGITARRNDSEYDRLEGLLLEKQGRRDEVHAEVVRAKSNGAKTEAESREVLALYGLVKGLADALSFDEIRPRLETAVQQFLGVEEFALYVSDLRTQSALHPLVTHRLGASVGASWETLQRYLKERQVALATPHRMEAPERAVLVPILEGHELMGYFFARVPAGRDAQALLNKAVAFSNDTAFAFRRIKLFQEVERLSQIDGLTGVARRGVLDERLRVEAVRAKTFRTTFCLMLLDIDHFKRLNDSYGHQFGDQVLGRIGEILRASVYETDFVARYGGEEFAILLPRAEPSGVLRKAEAVRANIERESFPLGMEVLRVTVSIGIAHFPRDGVTPEEVVYQADQALYYSKESGRNRATDIATVRR